MQLVTTALSTVSHLSDTSTQYLALDNPIAGLVPDFTVFGGEFDTWWKKLFAGLWALCLVGSIAWFAISITGLRHATESNIPGQVDSAKNKVAWSGGAVGGLVGLPIIIGAIFVIAGG